MKPKDLLANGLPFNRKERFFTATVLPALCLGSSLERLPRLFERLGVDADPPSWTLGTANTQVFTEYGIAESIRVDDPRFAGITLERDTPDMVIYQPDRLLIGLEAKMFERVSGGNLRLQLTRQREVLCALADGLDLPQEQVHQVALLPEQTANQIGGLPVPVITWAEVLTLFHGNHSRSRCWRCPRLSGPRVA